MRWSRLPALGLVVLMACARENGTGSGAEGDTLGTGDLALPPSAGASRPTGPAVAPDTVTAQEAAPLDTTAPGPGPTVGQVPPPQLDVGAIINVYRRSYQELYAEFGSDVRNGVDPKLVEDAKRRTALEHGFVDVRAWNDMVAQLSPSQRSELAERIAATNLELARELHTGRAPTSG